MSYLQKIPLLKKLFPIKANIQDAFNTAEFKQKNKIVFDELQNGNLPLGNEVLSALIASRTPLTATEKNLIEKIENSRLKLLNNPSPLVDNSLGNGGVYDDGISVQQAANVSKPFNQALTLFQMVRFCKPAKILELGTNVGVSSAYLGAAAQLNAKGKVNTFEASAYRIKLAKQIHVSVGLNNIEYIHGLFSDTLDNFLAKASDVDFAFIDGHHQYEPTLEYFDKIHKKSTQISVFFFDDIRWSDGMLKAWNEIIIDPRVIYSVDLNHTGFCVCTTRANNTPLNFVIEDVKFGKSKLQ